MNNIELDGIKLVKIILDSQTGTTKEIRSVSNIQIEQKRVIVEHTIPGAEANVLQDLGRSPARISFEGIFYAEDAKKNIEQLKAKYKTGEPISFLSDISSISDITQVLIEQFNITDISTATNTYKYTIVLREYIPPKVKEEKKPETTEEAKEDVEQKTDEAKKSLNYIIGRVIDAQGNPVKDASVKISYNEGEYTLTTNEKGVYRKDNLKPGKYTITVSHKNAKSSVTKEITIS